MKTIRIIFDWRLIKLGSAVINNMYPFLYKNFFYPFSTILCKNVIFFKHVAKMFWSLGDLYSDYNISYYFCIFERTDCLLERSLQNSRTYTTMSSLKALMSLNWCHFIHESISMYNRFLVHSNLGDVFKRNQLMPLMFSDSKFSQLHHTKDNPKTYLMI